MVQKFLSFLYRETKTLNQAALLLGFFAFLSQVLAFLRDRLLAHIFGVSAELDIYYAAFRIPDFIFVTVASVVSLSVLIPFIIEKDKQGLDSLREFIDSIFSFFSVLIVSFSVLAFILMPALSGFLFQGMSPDVLTEVVSMSRLLLLSPILLGFSNLFGSLTQAYNRFAVYALAPLLYNVGIIIGTIFLTERFGIFGVAIGVVVGASLHVLVQAPFVAKAGLLPRPSLRFNFAIIRRVTLISLPRTFTLSMTQISLIFLVSLASLMTTGSISILSLSFSLQSVPLSIIGVSYSLAAFPTLSRRFQENDLKAFIEQMSNTARFIIFWALPLTALFIVLRAQIVRVILGSGLFDWDDTRLTAAALALFILSSLFQCLLLLFMRGFYSAGHTKKPFYINLFSTIFLGLSAYGLTQVFYLNEGFRYFISSLLKVGDLTDTAVLMLPLGFSIATIVNALVHWYYFEKEFKGFSTRVRVTLIQSLGVSVIMGAAAYVGLNIFVNFSSTTSLVSIFLQGFLAGILAIVVGVVIFFALGNREIAEVWSVVKGRFWKTKVIATDPEIV
ncbi:MAG: lipid II flippase MurJ [Parcubacteria group bacterium]